MHPVLASVRAGTRLPVLELGGRPVPDPDARWTLLALGEHADREAAWHARRLEAEAVAVVVLPGARAPHAAVLVGPDGIVQLVTGSVGEALDAVHDLRTGDRLPVRPDPDAATRCPQQGRRRRRATTRLRRAG